MTMTETTSAQLVDAITGGQHDDSLDELREAVRARIKIVEYRTARALQVGDRVRVSGNISPKYLLGATGVVVGEVKGQRIEVTLDERRRKYPADIPMGFPIGCVEKID